MPELYWMRNDWMQRTRLSVGGPGLLSYLVYLLGFYRLIGDVFRSTRWLPPLLCMLLGTTCVLLLSLPTLRLCSNGRLLYVRRNGRLWQVDLGNLQALGVFPATSGRPWVQWPVSIQQAALQAALRAMDEAERGLPLQERVLLPMDRIRLERETPWFWQISFESGGVRQKQVIPKAYENFSPVPGLPQVQHPAPGRWALGCAILLTTALFTTGSWLLYQRSAPEPPPPPAVDLSQPTSSASVPDSKPVLQAREPEESAAYQMNGLEFSTDKTFRLQDDTLFDPALHVTYEIELQYGVAAQDLPALDQEAEGYRYRLSVHSLADGAMEYTGIARSEGGTLFTVQATQGSATGMEKIQGDMLYLLKHLSFTGPAVTEENFRTLLRPNLQVGCAYMGPAYLRAPRELLGYDAFVDTYLPYSQDVFCSDGGDAVQTQIHGLRVRVTIRACSGSAQDALNEIREELGISFQPKDIFDEKYDPDLEAACFLGAYYDSHSTTPRVLVLYTDGKWEGYYICREIICFPEQIDEEYAPMLKELEAVYGISVPTLEKLAE